MNDRRSRGRSSSSSPHRQSLSLSPARRRSPSLSPPRRRSLSPASSTSSIRGEGSTPASALFSNDSARRSRPQLGKRVSGVGIRNGTDDDFFKGASGDVDGGHEGGVLETESAVEQADEGIGSKAGIILVSCFITV